MKISKLLAELTIAKNTYGDLPISIEIEDSAKIKKIKTKLIKMSRLSMVFPNRKLIEINLS